MYDTLYTFHFLKRPYAIEPLMAESMPELLDGGREIIIKIKKGIPYHPSKYIPDGKMITAHDFVRSFKRLAYKHTGSRAWWLAKNIFVGLDELHEKANSLQELSSAILPGIKAVDDYTLKLTLKRTIPPHQILNLLAMSFTAPIPEEVFTKMNNDLSNTDVGSGAYTLIELSLKNETTLKAFKGYNTSQYPNVGDRYSHDKNLILDANKSIPFTDKVTFYVEPDDRKRWERFLKGEFSFIELPRPFVAEVLQDDGSLNKEILKKEIQIEQSPSLAFWFIEFNMTDPVLGKNKLLREAIAHSIDVKNFIWSFGHNADQQANSIYTPGIYGYSAARELPYKYNQEKAKELLRKAGYPNGSGLPLIIFDTRRETDFYVEQAKFIKRELESIGFKVEIRINTFSQFIERVKNRSMSMWQGGWLLDFPDAENILQLFYSKNSGNGGPNKSDFRNKKFDTLFEQVIKLENNSQKLATLEKMENIINQEIPIIMLYYSKNYFLYKKDIKNFRFNELSMGFLKYVRIGN